MFYIVAELRDTSTLYRKIEQLQAFNRELEAQFNSAIDMNTALKQQLILVPILEFSWTQIVNNF